MYQIDAVVPVTIEVQKVKRFAQAMRIIKSCTIQLLPDFGSLSKCACCERARVSTNKFIEKIKFGSQKLAGVWTPKRSIYYYSLITNLTVFKK